MSDLRIPQNPGIGGLKEFTDAETSFLQQLAGNGGTPDLNTYVPYTGASTDVNLGVYTLTTPILIGGTGTTDDLILRTTSGVGATGADMIFQGGSNGATEFARFLNSGDLGIGVASPSAKLHIIKTTEQLRVGYDASNYWNATTSSTGITTFNAVGSGSSFAFSDPLSVTGRIQATVTTEQLRLSYDASNRVTVTVDGNGRTFLNTAGSNPTFVFEDVVGVGTGTAVAANLHTQRTAANQFRTGYSATQYLNFDTSSTGVTTLNSVGTSPGLIFLINGTSNMTLASGGNLSLLGTSPQTLYLGTSTSGFVTAGGMNTREMGIYSGNGDETIAAFNANTGIYNYFNGTFSGDSTGITSLAPTNIYQSSFLGSSAAEAAFLNATYGSVGYFEDTSYGGVVKILNSSGAGDGIQIDVGTNYGIYCLSKGYFSDGVNTVEFADGTYAINSSGPMTLTSGAGYTVEIGNGTGLSVVSGSTVATLQDYGIMGNFSDGTNTVQISNGTSALDTYGNVRMTGLLSGVGPPGTILTDYNLYVDTLTGIVYIT